MFSRSTRAFAATAALAVLLPACTTVNLTGLNTNQTAENAPLSSVERSAQALNIAFANAGWTEKVKGSTPMTTLKILLKGLPETADDVTINRYAAAHTQGETVSDMVSAARYASQTAKVAQDYLASAGTKTDLIGELTQLERALSAAQSAKAMFAKVDTREIRPELTELTASVADLFDVTNAYGDRVRAEFMTPSTSASRS